MSIARDAFQLFSKTLSSQGLYLTKSLNFRKRKQSLPINLDYVRYATLGLCYEEMMAKNVQGNVAELGVYKGDFAKRLNKLFHDRTLYLFDTFEGFRKEDVEVEQSNSFSTGMQDFSDTSVASVMAKMPNPEKCVVKQGFFPESLQGLEDRFCFVSLDADLYQPILEGLRYFYPRLEKGGYIFVHDFSNEEYLGARQAVVEFCKEQNIGYSPIPDVGGTAIISK